MPVISVIVPVYKVEPFIHRCIDSILAQTYTDFELILVDDGSPDNCGKICDEYEKKDCRVRVMHQDNRGLAAARNLGIDISKGTYLFFCDSDDYLNPDCLLHCHSCSQKNSSAYIFGAFTNIYMINGNVQYTECMEPEENICYPIDALLHLKNNGFIGFACNVLFDNRIIQANKLRFRTDVIVEDLPFVFEYVRHMRSLVYTGFADYNYVHDERETLSKKYYKDGYRRWQEKYAITIQYIYDKLPKHKHETEFTDTADQYLYHFLSSLQNTFDKRNDDSLLEKIRFNNTILKTCEFQHCLKYTKKHNEDPRIIFLLKHTNFYVVYFFNQLVKFKQKLKGKHKS